jgi:hypothetical protein
MGLKLDNRSAIGGAKNFNPAPNAYDNKKFGSVKNQAPAFSLRSRYDTTKGANVPGPGQYDQNGSPKKRAASYVFGTQEQRASPKKD